jgi:hypothetical protein
MALYIYTVIPSFHFSILFGTGFFLLLCNIGLPGYSTTTFFRRLGVYNGIVALHGGLFGSECYTMI